MRLKFFGHRGHWNLVPGGFEFGFGIAGVFPCRLVGPLLVVMVVLVLDLSCSSAAVGLAVLKLLPLPASMVKPCVQ
jgi:hypothetical protein